MNKQKNIQYKKKITFFIPNFLIGGAENVFINLANQAINNNYKVEFVVGESKGPLKKKLNKNINIVSLNKNRISKCFFGLVVYLRKNNPDYFLSAMTHCNILSCIVAFFCRYNGKLIIKECNNFSTNFKRKNIKFYIIFWLVNFFYNISDKIICLSNGVKKDFLDNFSKLKKKINVVYNPININEIHKLSYEKILTKNNSKFKIISIGRLVKQKNFSNLIRAFEVVQSKVKKIHLIIIGDGYEKKKLKKLVSFLKIKKKVTFLGEVKNPYKYLKNSDLFVLSSDYEGFGTVILEAMVFNLPIVSTDCDYGPREILKKYNKKKLVKVNSYKSLSRGIIEMIKISKKTKKFNFENYNTEYILSKYLH